MPPPDRPAPPGEPTEADAPMGSPGDPGEELFVREARKEPTHVEVQTIRHLGIDAPDLTGTSVMTI